MKQCLVNECGEAKEEAKQESRQEHQQCSKDRPLLICVNTAVPFEGFMFAAFPLVTLELRLRQGKIPESALEKGRFGLPGVT